MPTTLPPTRAANLCDFDGLCPSADAWQQQHAIDVYYRWKGGLVDLTLLQTTSQLVVNWGSTRFTAPGSHAEYYDGLARPLFLRDQSLHAVYLLSVLDRIERPQRLLRQLVPALVPHGLVILTFALWDAMGEDCAYGHQLRQRIYDRLTWKRLLQDVRTLGFRPFGAVNFGYPGDTLGDHSLAATSLTKEP